MLELSISLDGFVAGPDIGVDTPMGVTASNDADRLSGYLADGFAGVGPLHPDYIQMGVTVS